MDLISKAIDEIKFRIPRDVLQLAYIGKTDFHTAPISLEERIRRTTINARVIVDTNIVSGETVLVDLSDLQPHQEDNYNYVFEIPPARLNYRPILSPLSVNYMAYNNVMNSYIPGTTASYPVGTNDITSAAHRAMDSRSNIPIVSNSEVVAVGPFTIMVRNHLITASVRQLRCVVCHEDRLSNISIRNAPVFSRLCELAVKSYIHNELLIKLDRGYLSGGQELGSLKAYVEGLADAEQMYQDCLHDEWAAITVMNDRVTYEDLLRIQIDPGM